MHVSTCLICLRAFFKSTFNLCGEISYMKLCKCIIVGRTGAVVKPRGPWFEPQHGIEQVIFTQLMR